MNYYELLKPLLNKNVSMFTFVTDETEERIIQKTVGFPVLKSLTEDYVSFEDSVEKYKVDLEELSHLEFEIDGEKIISLYSPQNHHNRFIISSDKKSEVKLFEKEYSDLLLNQ